MLDAGVGDFLSDKSTENLDREWDACMHAPVKTDRTVRFRPVHFTLSNYTSINKNWLEKRQ